VLGKGGYVVRRVLSGLRDNLPTVARQHWFFLTLFGAGLVLRVVVMIAYRPVLLYIDSLGSYLSSLPTLDPAGQDPIGYDVLLLKPVFAVGTLATVAAVQHLLGLGMAVVTYALIVHKGRLVTGRWRALAALATAPILLDAYQLQIEHMIMSDSLFQALLVTAFAILVWPDRPNWWRVALAGLLLGAAVTVRAVGELTILAAVGYILIATRGWWRRGLLAAITAAAFALPLAIYVGHFHAVTGRWGLTNVSGTTIYGRVATFADCTGLALPPYQRPLCPTIPLAQRMGPDYWAHDPASPANRPIAAPPGKTGDDVLRDFSMRVIRHQPVEFARSVLFDSVRVFSWQRINGKDPGQPVVERWQFQAGYQWYPPVVTPETAAAAGARFGGGPARVVVPLATALRWYQLHIGYTPGPLLALSLLLVLLVVSGVPRRVRRSPLRGVLLLYLMGTAVAVGLADVFLFSWRYQLPAYVLLPAAGVLALAALLREVPRETCRDDSVPQRGVDSSPGLRAHADVDSGGGQH
jgi:hypothetical protein